MPRLNVLQTFVQSARDEGKPDRTVVTPVTVVVV